MVTLASEPGALDLFWFPMSIFIIGMILVFTRNPPKIQKMGLILATIGSLFIAISPFTLPNSPSSAFGQLVLFLIGPVVLLILANFTSIKFRHYKKKDLLRTLFLISGLSWIIIIWLGVPQFNNSDNELWLLWVVSVEIISALILFSLAYLEEKNNAKMLFFLLGFLILLLNEELLGIPNASRSLLINTSGTILGTIIGLCIGVLIWFYTIQKLHSLEKDLEMDKELTQEEEKLLITKLSEDLKWLKNSKVGEEK
ncbi:MAG TPA: hypothetical protein QF644_04325 [Candidatus Poseidoniaceae archaeon]|nr:hypothetical protein [Candidatus Poseidoniaceae archaeon]